MLERRVRKGKIMYKLLIVDDESFIRRGIKELIDMKGLGISQVIEASNGAEALIKAKEFSPHIILADINMPIMNGLDFAFEARKILPNTKIAMITGYDYFDYTVTALKAGVDDYVLKPVSRDDITILLKKLVDKLHVEKADRIANKTIHELNGYIGAETDNSYSDRLDRILKDNISKSTFSLLKLADELHLTSGYVSSKFREIYGLNFQDYVVKLRLSKAKLLLLSSDMKMYEIAEACGFDDPNYFSASFKRNIGTSPSQFRKEAGSIDE